MSFGVYSLIFNTVQVILQQPIVINSYKVIFDSYFSINYTGAKHPNIAAKKIINCHS